MDKEKMLYESLEVDETYNIYESTDKSKYVAEFMPWNKVNYYNAYLRSYVARENDVVYEHAVRAYKKARKKLSAIHKKSSFVLQMDWFPSRPYDACELFATEMKAFREQMSKERETGMYVSGAEIFYRLLKEKEVYDYLDIKSQWMLDELRKRAANVEQVYSYIQQQNQERGS